MIPLSNTQVANGNPLTRLEIINLLNKANHVQAERFSRQLASHWLKHYPGDLQVKLIHAQSLLNYEKTDSAISILKNICNIDPEFLNAQRSLAFSSDEVSNPFITTAQACLFVLGGKGISSDTLPKWGNLLRQANEENKQGNKEESEVLYQQALSEEPKTPLAAVMHLRFASEEFEWLAIHKLAAKYQEQWPDCLACNLVLADVLMAGGQEEHAVTLLHHAVSLDTAGQVPIRLWGAKHPYINLWPQNPKISLPFPIPADVTAALGWNHLASGEINSPSIKTKKQKTTRPKKDKVTESKTRKISDSTIRSVRAEIERLAMKIKRPEISKSDGRFPAFIVLTTREGLENHYGSSNLNKIHEAMQKVEKATRELNHWDAHLIYADDGESVDRFNIPPAKANDPWSIKNLLIDLEKALSQRGEMIGAVLIVGGPKVVPFHHLPNPVDDFDTDIPSDNPYASRDENYFIQSWPVGRLPGGANNDPIPLIDQLESINLRRTQKKPRWSLWRKFTELFKKFLPTSKLEPSFGYTAEIWRRAANSVFRPIGKPHTLVISPPTEADQINKRHSKTVDLAYYNLHGLEDNPEWYGQRDPIETSEGPDFPVALRPQDIVNSGRAPQIVFSEACFGANIIEKTLEDAICLKFLSSGTQAIVGSTCTSYGSITTPLIAADLLGKAFWRFLQDGYHAGEALRRAKIHFVREMHKRQGYLDGEDQKTLISFVLYGDPLALPFKQSEKEKNILRIPIESSRVKTICDKASKSQPPQIPDDILRQVKRIVKNYLPGMAGANILYSQAHSKCQGHNCPTPDNGVKSLPHQKSHRKVVTLSKQIVRGNNTHPQHARITLNKDGKITKLAISR